MKHRLLSTGYILLIALPFLMLAVFAGARELISDIRFIWSDEVSR